MTAAQRRARDLHVRGRAAVDAGRSARGLRLFRSALALLGTASPEDGAAAARVRISMAAAEVHLGRTAAGFALLDEAERTVAPEDRGTLLLQRGLLCILTGRVEEALRHLNEGIPLHSGTDDHHDLAAALLNRAMVHGLAGRPRIAKADLERCEEISRAADLPLMVAKAQLNRGYCEMLMGDIPAALNAFDLAKPGFALHAEGLLPVLAVDRARTLMQAGLADEAAAELDEAIRLLGRSGPTYERGEAALTRASAAVMQGDAREARLWARRAERLFLRRGDRSWAAVAVLTRLRADFQAGRGLAAIAAEAVDVAATLHRLGLPNDGEAATLLAARALVRLGRNGEALAQLSKRRSPSPVLETVLLRRLAAAEWYAATGDSTRAFRQAGAGLRVLHGRRGRFGSIDLRTGTAAMGVDLAAVGLATALRRGRASTVFAWAERSRAQAFLMSPARPPTDTETSDAVAELRRLATVVRAAELAGCPDPDVARRCAELEHTIRARGWRAPGDGEQDSPNSLHEVAAELGDAVLVDFLPFEGRLLGLVVVDGTSRMVSFGDLAAVAETAARLRSDLDALCGRRHQAPLVEVVELSLRHHLASLQEQLLTPVGALLGDRDLVVVPTGPLSGVPWGLLDGLRGRPVTVTPSASVWLRGRRPTGRATTSEPLLVAGPGPGHAPGEVGKIAEVVPGSTVLTGGAASVGATLAAMEDRRMVHFAAHGHHEPGNILFSRLDLADGPLMAHDIGTLPAAPEHVVLSSCDTGRSVVRAGDEMLGFAAAFLYGGARTVVAGVARVPDDAVVDVMTTYHDLVHRGTAPARALAEASRATPLMPLVCFGSG
ncbi:CHAT domain-containing tetratricopeptide repeat protein [Umezawaea sp.]|uniref:CHAT domain-containing protein n=1 Tax=Umezawaea sp. TaxID=1955258 RepID=UPI002ED1130E